MKAQMFEQPPTFGPIEDDVFAKLLEQYPENGQTYHGDVGNYRYDAELDKLLDPVTALIVNEPLLGFNGKEPSVIRYLLKTNTVKPDHTLHTAGWHTDKFGLAMVASRDDQTTIFAVRNKLAEVGLSHSQRYRLQQERREFLDLTPPAKTFKHGITDDDMERLRLMPWRSKAGEFAIFHADMPHCSPVNDGPEPRERTCLQAWVVHRRKSLAGILLDRAFSSLR